MIEDELHDAKGETQYEQNDKDRKKLREMAHDAQADSRQGLPNPAEDYQKVAARYRQLHRDGQQRKRDNQQRKDKMRQRQAIPHKFEPLQWREQLQVAEADWLYRITV